ncbi:KipI antagonist [compost metagenome]
MVGNAPDAPALELLVQGPTLEVQADSVRLALAGCNGQIEIGGPRRRRIPAGRSARAVRGETVRIVSLGDSACAYLAIEGGMVAQPVLGSVSTYVRGGLGGFAGRALAQGDDIGLLANEVSARVERALDKPFDIGLAQAIRVVLGPQDDYFAEDAIQAFLSAEYLVSPQSDRMGFRLDGTSVAHAAGYNIVSDGIVAGSIQVPGSGLPIVLMADAQTTGGYPKIGTVISADIPVLARRKPGSAVRFAAISRQEAEAARRSQESGLAASIRNMTELNDAGVVDVAALASANLTSGLVSLREDRAAE